MYEQGDKGVNFLSQAITGMILIYLTMSILLGHPLSPTNKYETAPMTGGSENAEDHNGFNSVDVTGVSDKKDMNGWDTTEEW